MYFAGPVASPREPTWLEDRVFLQILGGSPSSRLFTKLREERGLVYSTWAHHYEFFDQRLAIIMADGAAKNGKEMAGLVWDELQLMTRFDSGSELNRAKKELSVSWLMKNDDFQDRAANNAEDLHRLGKVDEISETIESLSKLTVEAIREAAKRFFQSNISLAIHGQNRHLSNLSELKQREFPTAGSSKAA